MSGGTVGVLSVAFAGSTLPSQACTMGCVTSGHGWPVQSNDRGAIASTELCISGEDNGRKCVKL